MTDEETLELMLEIRERHPYVADYTCECGVTIDSSNVPREFCRHLFTEMMKELVVLEREDFQRHIADAYLQGREDQRTHLSRAFKKFADAVVKAERTANVIATKGATVPGRITATLRAEERAQTFGAVRIMAQETLRKVGLDDHET